MSAEDLAKQFADLLLKIQTAQPAESSQSAEARRAADVASRLSSLLTKFGAPSAAQLPLEHCLFLATGANIEPAPKNPVPRPPNAEFGRWFDSRRTAEGLRIADALRPGSGFYQEYSNWAPVVSFLFDWFVRFAQFSSCNELPEAVRTALVPAVESLSKVVELSTTVLDQRLLQAAHVGTPLEDAWKTLATAVRLGDQKNTFQGDLTQSTVSAIQSAQQKAAVKAQSERKVRATKAREQGSSGQKQARFRKGSGGKRRDSTPDSEPSA